MKNIKKYEKFLNEELNSSTYLSAADKLKKKGHNNRSKNLSDHVYNSIHKPINEIVVVNNVEYVITDDNIITRKGRVIISFDEKKEIYITVECGYDDGDEDWGEFVWDIDIYGIDKIDRKNAFKIFKIFKQHLLELSITDDPMFSKVLDKITVNDFYKD